MDGGDSPTQQPHHQPFQFSPILIGLLGIILGAIMVATYQCIAISCNYRRGPVLNPTAFRREQELARRRARPLNRDRYDSITMVRVLRLMPVFKYTKGGEEGTCAVCLGEFSEGEELRTLPLCSHSFHAPCVDMWLFSHANCPLCRAGVFSSPAPPPELRLVVAMPMSEEGPPAGVARMPELGV